jgi:hypothetical protein
MVYNTQDYWTFGLCPSSIILKAKKNTTFRKLNLFPERWAFCVFKIKKDGQVKNPSNSECFTFRENILRFASREKRICGSRFLLTEFVGFQIFERKGIYRIL